MLKHKDYNAGTDLENFANPEIPERISSIHKYLEKSR